MAAPVRNRGAGVLSAMCVLSLSAGLTGCGPAPVGLAGIGLDGQGRLVGHLQVCRHQLDGATLYRTETDKRGKWRAAEPVTNSASWSMDSPDSGWTALQPYAAPDGDSEYTLYGWTANNSWSADAVTFQLRDLVDMLPGQVAYLKKGELVRAEEVDFEHDACLRA